MTPVETADELAEKLTQRTWAKCSGFQHAGHFFLNDSSSLSDAQQYAVVQRLVGEEFAQLESILIGSMNPKDALETIQWIVRGKSDALMSDTLKLRIEWPELHGRCHHCP